MKSKARGRDQRFGSILTLMKAIHVTAVGGPEVLKTVEVPEPEVAPGTLRVRNRAVGINFHDVQSRRRGVRGQKYPFIPGTDFAGEVEAIGEGVEGFATGDRVLGVSMAGAYAEKSVVPAVLATAIPDHISYEQAAACPLSGLTACFMIRDHGVGETTNVVVHAAAGSVGCFMGGLLAQRRAPSIGLVSTEVKAEVARRAGYLHVINYRREDPVERVRQLTASAGADVVYDSVAGPGFARSFEMCRAGGTVVVFGRAGGDPPRGVLDEAFLGAARNLGLRTYFLGTTLFSDPQSHRDAYATLFDGLASGAIYLPIEALPLEAVADAHARIEAQQTVGKLILLP
jgi:NADPH2:quinone reductase